MGPFITALSVVSEEDDTESWSGQTASQEEKLLFSQMLNLFWPLWVVLPISSKSTSISEYKKNFTMHEQGLLQSPKHSLGHEVFRILEAVFGLAITFHFQYNYNFSIVGLLNYGDFV